MLTYIEPVKGMISDRLQRAIESARQISGRRGIKVEDWVAGAIEAKNELEAGSTVFERGQDRD